MKVVVSFSAGNTKTIPCFLWTVGVPFWLGQATAQSWHNIHIKYMAERNFTGIRLFPRSCKQGTGAERHCQNAKATRLRRAHSTRGGGHADPVLHSPGRSCAIYCRCAGKPVYYGHRS